MRNPNSRRGDGGDGWVCIPADGEALPIPPFGKIAPMHPAALRPTV
jgi:hypothetical protein